MHLKSALIPSEARSILASLKFVWFLCELLKKSCPPRHSESSSNVSSNNVNQHEVPPQRKMAAILQQHHLTPIPY